MKQPYVILISNDGFRYDYAEKFTKLLICLNLHAKVFGQRRNPSHPSITFPQPLRL